MSCGENAWVSLADMPSGSGLSVKLESGSAEIDGHPIPTKELVTFNSGQDDYFINTWTGCKFSIHVPSGTSAVRWVKSSSMHPFLSRCTRFEKILFVDLTPNAAITMANFLYRRQTDQSKRVFMLNLDTRNNSGVACLYKLNRTIPPHHPLDHLPELKQMFWCHQDLDYFVHVLGDVLSTVSNLVVYMNYSCCSIEDITTVCETFSLDCCVTSSDHVYYSSKTVDNQDCSYFMKLPPILTGSITRDPCVVSAEGVYRNIFLQKFKTHHFSGEGMTSFDKLPTALLPMGKGREKAISVYVDQKGLPGSKVYAVVSGENQRIMSFWGFVYVDCNIRCHSMLPAKNVREMTLVFVRDLML